MPGPYNIPIVSYAGVTPDPVEWANDFVKPALDNLLGRGLMHPRSGEILTPLGYTYSPGPEGALMADQTVWGCVFRIDHTCSLTWAKFRVLTASSVSGATVDVVLYRLSTEELVGTFGSAAVDSTGYKQITPGTAIPITEPDYYLAAFRPRTAVTGLVVTGFRSASVNGVPMVYWNDWDYPNEAQLTWDVAGTGAAPASLLSYTRRSGGYATHSPVFALGVTP